MTVDDAAARQRAAAALQRLRDAAGHLLSTLTDAQPVAPHHLLALRAIADGASTPSDLAAATGRHASTVTRVVDQLVELDLLHRAVDPDDRRQVLVSLTTDGRGVVDAFERLDDMVSQRLLADFDAADAGMLATYLDRIATTAADLAAAFEDDPMQLAPDAGA